VTHAEVTESWKTLPVGSQVALKFLHRQALKNHEGVDILSYRFFVTWTDILSALESGRIGPKDV